MCEQCVRNRTAVLMFANKAAQELGFASAVPAIAWWTSKPANQAMAGMIACSPEDDAFVALGQFVSARIGARAINLEELNELVLVDANWQKTMTQADHNQARKRLRDHPYFALLCDAIREVQPEFVAQTEAWANSDEPFEKLDIAVAGRPDPPQNMPHLPPELVGVLRKMATMGESPYIVMLNGTPGAGGAGERAEDDSGLPPILPPVPKLLQ